MATVKAQNYSPEQVQTMKADYTKATDAETREAVVLHLAETFGKSKRSIVSKMSREGYYIAKKVISKVTGETPAKKDALAVQLREVSGLPMVSAEKLNKTDIQDLIARSVEFNKMRETIAEYNEVPAEFADIDPDLSGGQETES